MYGSSILSMLEYTIVASCSSRSFAAADSQHQHHFNGADAQGFNRPSLFSIMWAGADIFELFSINVGPFSSNVSRKTPLFSINLGRSRRCFRARALMFSSRYSSSIHLQLHRLMCR